MLRTSTSVPAVRANTARAQMLWTATHARARADGKGTTAGPISMTVRLHHAIMMGVAQIVPTRIFASVPPDGAERTAQRTSTSVPAIRASTVGAVMAWMPTDVAVHQAGKVTIATWILMTACPSLAPTVASVVTTLMNTHAGAREAGAERTAEKTLTSVRHPHVCTDSVQTSLRPTAANVFWVGTEKIVRSTSTSAQVGHAEIPRSGHVSTT